MTDQSSKLAEESNTGEATKSLLSKISPISAKNRKRDAQSAFGATGTNVSKEETGHENKRKSKLLPALGNVDVMKDTPYHWARMISEKVEFELMRIIDEAEEKQKLLDGDEDPWKTCRDDTRTLIEKRLNPQILIYLERLEAGEDCHARWMAPPWPKQLEPLVALAGSQLQKGRRLMGALSPAEFAVWLMHQPGCYWYFRVVLMQCNIPGEDWLGVMRAAQDVAVVAGSREAIMESFFP